MVNIPSLSFCITCKNRLYQISRTLKQNLDDNRLHQRFVEFILVDFGSTDGLREWVLTEFADDLASGYLRYYYTDGLPYWHASVAKNTSHWCARHDIVVNLDCDNYTGYLGGRFVINTFVQNCMDIVFHQFSGNIDDGCYGRISVLRKHFDRIGGYDESLDPMSYQDDDLMKRLKEFGLTHILNPLKIYNQCINNSKSEGLLYTDTNKDYLSMLRDNRQKSEDHLSEGYLIANNGIFGIREDLTDHRGKSYSHVSEQ